MAEGLNRRHVDTIPAREVEGTIVYLNERIIPDEIREFFQGLGKKCGLALMVSTTVPKNELHVQVRTGHNRSISLGWMSMGGGKVFVDSKGVGNIYDNHGNLLEAGLAKINETNGRIEGFLQRSHGDWDREVSDELSHEKACGHRVFSIVELDEIVTSDVLTHTEQRVPARKWLHNAINKVIDKRLRNWLTKNGPLVIAFREFTEEYRVVDITRDKSGRRLAEVIKRLQEKGHSEVNDFETYFNLFCAEFGRCLGCMHRKRITHGFPSDHNVLADGKPTDFDSCTRPQEYGVMRSRNRPELIQLNHSAGRKKFVDRIIEDFNQAQTTIYDLWTPFRNLTTPESQPETRGKSLENGQKLFKEAYNRETVHKGEPWSYERIEEIQTRKVFGRKTRLRTEVESQ